MIPPAARWFEPDIGMLRNTPRATRGTDEVSEYISDHGDPYVFPAGVAKQEHHEEWCVGYAFPAVR